MIYHISLRFLYVASFLHLVSWIQHSDATGQCMSQVSIFRKALKGHTIDKFHVIRPDICIKSCQIEPRCQSINYVMKENICELNNRSKKARPEHFMTDEGRIYMTVPFNKGKCLFFIFINYCTGVLFYWLSREEKAAWPSGLRAEFESGGPWFKPSTVSAFWICSW